MKKVAIFTEGQSELIFVRHLILLIYSYDIVRIECLKLHAGDFQNVPYPIGSLNPKIHFAIVIVGNDVGVVTTIQDRESDLINKGYDEIIGLRDMWSEAYRRRSRNVDDSVIASIVEAYNSTIESMNNPQKISLYFAIMELEAWFLSMYNLFRKIHSDLTVKFIEDKLGYDLARISPQRKFVNPAVRLGKIFDLVGKKYDKSGDLMESIVSHIEESDLDNAVENDRCPSFGKFLAKIRSFSD